ncbi:hypothetical protein [Streptococcus uberis]|uniref:hypothetical protein n=1 Tax=Streptococcus uberis TaxID=1349 RepID=UPI001FF41F7C|nr:hypothetical protein [Streptococcus uberis]MCK1157642.1 hypothetical protein [Streptococcus uberis]MCK1250929.1 hypothetical protein [Streptococcus uberis]
MRRVSANWIDFYFLSYISGSIWIAIFYLLHKFTNPILIANYHEPYKIFYYSFLSIVLSVHIYILTKRRIWLQNRKLYTFIKKNKLYDKKINKNGSEIIVDSIEMEWIEDDEKLMIRVFKTGGPLDDMIDSSMGSKLQAFLKKELTRENSGVDYIDYFFAIESDERLTL